VTLISAPTIGIAPAGIGFGKCPNPNASYNLGKPDTVYGAGAVQVGNNSNLAFKNGIVQCIYGPAFYLYGQGSALTIDSTVIQNTQVALFASSGTATVSSSIIRFNNEGVEQENSAAVDLSGGNTIVCSSIAERTSALQSCPPVSVFNGGSGNLDARNVSWDTPGPDLFSCDPNLYDCACEIGSCTRAGFSDPNLPDGGFAYNGFDAVYISTGTILTDGGTLSSIDCNAP
jgi:hypothetical protein